MIKHGFEVFRLNFGLFLDRDEVIIVRIKRTQGVDIIDFISFKIPFEATNTVFLEGLLLSNFKDKLSQLFHQYAKSSTGIFSNGVAGLTCEPGSTSTARALDQSAQSLTPHSVHTRIGSGGNSRRTQLKLLGVTDRGSKTTSHFSCKKMATRIRFIWTIVDGAIRQVVTWQH